MDNYFKSLVEIFRENSNEKDSISFEKYMRNKFKFLGIKSPRRNEIIKEYFKNYGKPVSNKTNAYIKYLWNLEEREFQHLALLIFEKNIKNLQSEDIDLIEFVISNKSWWDTVDGTIKISGAYFKKYPEQIDIFITKWINSDDFWFRRSAILFQLKYKMETDKELLFNLIKKTSSEKEFFIRKAIGWALREYSKYNPGDVIEFAENNQLSNLSKKEALRLLNK
jgi:3-methyladenine DNA glycosylase AlkD